MHSLMCVSPLLHVSRMNSLMLSSYSLRATDLTRYARRYYAHILCTSAIHSPQLAVLTRYQGPLACIACVPPATRMAAAATEHSAGTFRCTQRKRAAAPWRAANAAASNHVLRWALRCLTAAINGMELGNHTTNRKQEAHLEFATTIEVWAGTRSTLTRESYELGNAAVRVVAPSAHMRARPGCAPWNLRLGRTYTWPLDLEKPAHAKKLMEYIREVKPAPGSKSMHLHTSPPCSTFSPVQRIVKGKGGKPRTPWPIALQRLKFARRLHRAWSRRAFPGRVTSSHEQAKNCSIHPAMRKRGPEDLHMYL